MRIIERKKRGEKKNDDCSNERPLRNDDCSNNERTKKEWVILSWIKRVSSWLWILFVERALNLHWVGGGRFGESARTPLSQLATPRSQLAGLDLLKVLVALNPRRL